MMTKRKQVIRYLTSDYIASILAWTMFFLYRKIYIEPIKFGIPIPITFTAHFYLGITIIPLFWLLLHFSTGFYKMTLKKTHLIDLEQTIVVTFFGVMVIFFSLILDDEVYSYKNYYVLVLILFSLQFFFTYLFRTILTSILRTKIKRGKIGFSTLIIGNGPRAQNVNARVKKELKWNGNQVKGFVSTNDQAGQQINGFKHFGNLDQLRDIIRENSIEEIIVALEQNEYQLTEVILDKLVDIDTTIKVTPEMYDALKGKIKMSGIFGSHLLLVSSSPMPAWQQTFKEFFDVVFSLSVLIVTLPLSLFLIIGVKLTSKGPVFYSQERIGKRGKPFKIYKFRSMYQNAEESNPLLSNKNDKRVTPFGKFMRRTKFDELPNFLNVLKGDMSLVGPRAERQFFIDQIVQKAPHYVQLHKVKPGITSLGQVMFGYAENVDEMLQRLRYDMMYLENTSLLFDFKILAYTIIIILKGKGVVRK